MYALKILGERLGEPIEPESKGINEYVGFGIKITLQKLCLLNRQL